MNNYKGMLIVLTLSISLSIGTKITIMRWTKSPKIMSSKRKNTLKSVGKLTLWNYFCILLFYCIFLKKHHDLFLEFVEEQFCILGDSLPWTVR